MKLLELFITSSLLITINVVVLAQTPTPTTIVDTRLLQEATQQLRQLRVTLQQSTVNDHRAQILIEQIVRQTNRVDALEEDLAQQKFDLILGMLQLEREIPLDIKEIELGLEDERELEPPVSLTLRIVGTKQEKERLEERLQQDRQKMLETQTALGHAQQHLRDLENQLFVLTQELDTLLLPTKAGRKKD